MPFKAAISLLFSILFSAGFAVLAYTDLFDLIETRFYNPALIRSSGRKIGESAKAMGVYLSGLQDRFAASLAEGAVRSSFILNQREEDIFERSRIYGTMLESQNGLQAVRFVDSGGSRIHFSSSPQDILRQDRNSIAYRAYNDSGGDLSFGEVESPGQGRGRIVFDEAGERLIFSFPFYDSLDVYRGSALFYLSARAVTEQLIREGLVKIGNDVSVVANPGGLVLGLPAGEKHILAPLIASAWSEGILSPARLVSEETPVSLALISAKTGDIFAGLLLDESLFAISPVMKIVLLASFFFTVYLVVFLCFNLRQDPVAVVENRLKRLRIALLEHYWDTPDETERNRWTRELGLRREEIRLELKRGLKTKGGELDNLIDRSWDEFLSALGGYRNGIDEKKLAEILNRIFRNLPVSAPASYPANSDPSPATEKTDSVPAPSVRAAEPGEPEEFEELDELEEPEGPGASPAEAGEPEEPEELEELEELEEEPGDMEELEELEELEEPEESAEDTAAEVSPAKTGEPEELEELEEPDEEPAELEELEEEPPRESPAGPPMTGARIDEIAREIEFADSPPEEDSGEDFAMNLDIASPFDVMTFEPGGETADDDPVSRQDQSGTDSNVSSPNPEDEKKNSSQAPADNGGEEELEELAVVSETGLEELGGNGGLPYIYPPFRLAGFQNLTLLKVLPNDLSLAEAADALAGMRIIEEREGLHYISDGAFKGDRKTEQALNREFKDLVDSVLGETNRT
ncbi:MAG: hypothetical protein LBL70_00515 [Treponema sp.]|jgi:hypothetical protein|nr:hypothetical protein [Treponema sp.]